MNEAAYELGGGDGQVAGDIAEAQEAFDTLISRVPLEVLKDECVRTIGGTVDIRTSPAAQQAEADKAAIARTINPKAAAEKAEAIAAAPTHAALKRVVGSNHLRAVATPHVHAMVPITRVPKVARKALVAQIRTGKVPHPKHVRAKFRQLAGLDDDDFGEAVEVAKTGVGEAASSASGKVTPGQPPPEAAAKAKANGWPPPAAYRPGNWDFDASTYVLAFGDTLSGLAITYLGTPQRWKEIWEAQDQQFRFSHSPDKLMAGQKLSMPFEARDMAKAMLATPGSNPPAPSTIGKKAPIPVAGENQNAPTVAGGTKAAVEAKGKSLIKPLAIGAGVLAVGGVAYYALS